MKISSFLAQNHSFRIENLSFFLTSPATCFHAEFLLFKIEFMILNTKITISTRSNLFMNACPTPLYLESHYKRPIVNRSSSFLSGNSPLSLHIQQKAPNKSIIYIIIAYLWISIASPCSFAVWRSCNTIMKEIYQSPACVYNHERDLSIAGMCIQS